MTVPALLPALVDQNIFIPSPLPLDLVACHVPFDELVPGVRVESALEDFARRSVKAAVVGASGSGKSAVTAWVYDRIAFDFAPIRAPVFYETEETVREPGAFARYLVQRLLDEALAAAALSDRERDELLQQSSERLTTRTRTVGHTTGGALEVPWLLKGEAAREVSTTLEGAALAGTTDAVLAAIDRTIDALAQRQGLTPIIVLDDTDRWLRVGQVDRRELVGRFFGTIVRMLSERGCGLVVAVHETYLDMPEYVDGTRGFLTDDVTVPTLPSGAAIAEILTRRIQLCADDAAATDVFDAAAIDRLYAYYRSEGRRSLRWTLQTAHTALTDTVAAGAPVVGVAAVDDAAAA